MHADITFLRKVDLPFISRTTEDFISISLQINFRQFTYMCMYDYTVPFDKYTMVFLLVSDIVLLTTHNVFVNTIQCSSKSR